MSWAAAAGATASAVGSGISALLGISNSRAQRRWAERMSNTAYQRTMVDMRLAGLNPILAYQQGGSPIGGGSTAKTPDFGQAASTAVGAFKAGTEKSKTVQQVKNLKVEEINSAQTFKNLQAQEKKEMALTEAASAQAQNSLFQAKGTALDNLAKESSLPDKQGLAQFYKDHPTLRNVSRYMEMFGLKGPSFSYGGSTSSSRNRIIYEESK